MPAPSILRISEFEKFFGADQILERVSRQVARPRGLERPHRRGGRAGQAARPARSKATSLAGWRGKAHVFTSVAKGFATPIPRWFGEGREGGRFARGEGWDKYESETTN